MIYKHDGTIIADTVDGIGLVCDIVFNKKFTLKSKKILIIGSGFVLDSILLDVIAHNPMQISILARNKERVNYLMKIFAITEFDELMDYDIVLNSTPNSPDNLLFAVLKHLPNDALCYDLSYVQESIFLQKMKKLNPTVNNYNGLGMLVEQAKVVFTTLFKYEPDTALILRQLAVMEYQ